MFDAMFIGLSGMHAYSSGLKQISNNITNLNSSGFRASSVIFSDLFQEGASGTSYTGGGLGTGSGVQLSERRLDFSAGELRQSGRDLDLAIDGTGFLVLDNDGEYLYTRTGSFQVDEDGYIVLSGTDYKLTVLDEAGVAVGVSIDSYRTNLPKPTTTVMFEGNLSSDDTEHNIGDLTIYDAVGVTDNWQVKFVRDELIEDEWLVTVTNSAGDEIGSQMLRFANEIANTETETLTFEEQDTGRSVVFDFSENVTSVPISSISDLHFEDIDGFGLGEITGVHVSDTGVFEISYSNEQTVDLGAVTIANFLNPQALEQRSGSLFVYNQSTGADFHASESVKVGRVLSSRIEASNVDLSQQFGDLILVQRGYQASSQIVSVSNDMIQQLFGIRGQG